jgi:hypothetical protein
LEHFELNRLDFQPYYEDKSGCVSIIVPDPKEPHQHRPALGYIKYDKKAGRVTLANSCAQIQPSDIVQGITMISKILKKEPTMLPRMLWDLLPPSSSIRTAEEEQIELFKNAELCAPESTFAGAILRAVSACIAMLKQTEHMTIRLLQSNMSDVDFFFDSKRSTLNIHHKRLHRQYSRRDSGDVAAQDAVVFCDHIIENVLSMLLATVFSTAPTSYRSKMQTVQHVRHMLRLMPQRVVLKQSLPGMLVFSWEDNETELFRKHGRQYHVVLHEEKCMDLRRAFTWALEPPWVGPPSVWR